MSRNQEKQFGSSDSQVANLWRKSLRDAADSIKMPDTFISLSTTKLKWPGIVLKRGRNNTRSAHRNLKMMFSKQTFSCHERGEESNKWRLMVQIFDNWINKSEHVTGRLESLTACFNLYVIGPNLRVGLGFPTSDPIFYRKTVTYYFSCTLFICSLLG